MNDYCAMCGDPINTATGAYVYQHRDIEITTKGLPLSFERTYNSNDRSDGDLGRGWSHSWQVSANPLPGGDVVILRGDGRQDTFTLNADGSFSPPPGRHDTLSQNADSTYTLLTLDQTTYSFDQANRLASEVAENGQATTFAYDANRRLATITGPAGRMLAFTYNAQGRIDEITDPAGNTVSFLYSPGGDLVQVTDQNGAVTAFSYDEEHRIISVTDPNGNTRANNSYDSSGRVTSQVEAEGNLLSFSYDEVNDSASDTKIVTTMTRQMDPGDPAKDQVTNFYYDFLYRLKRKTDSYGKDTLYTYDSRGNRDSVTDRRGVVNKKVFDQYGNVTDSYKAFGTPEEQHTQTVYNSRNKPLTVTDARGNTTSYSYDAPGTYLLEIDYPQVTDYSGGTASYSEFFTYNGDGTLATHTDRNGDVTIYTYDPNGYPDVVTEIGRAHV